MSSAAHGETGWHPAGELAYREGRIVVYSALGSHGSYQALGKHEP